MAKSIYGNVVTSATFQSGNARRKKFLGLLFIAIFWNGIMWTMTFFLFRHLGKIAIFPMLFMSLFLLVGLGLIAWLAHSFFALFNPALEFEIDHIPVRLGEKLTVTWSFTGQVGRIQRLQVYLEGREQARYRRGTNTHTDTSTFLRLDVADTSEMREIASGRTTLDIPATTMHSFDGGDNQILWRFVVHGDIPGRPDLKDEIDIQLLPHVAGGSMPLAEVPS